MNTVDVMLCSSLWINVGRGLQHAFVPRRQQAIEATDQILITLVKAPLQTAWRQLCARYPQGFPHGLGATLVLGGTLSAISGRWISSAVMAQSFQSCRLQRSVQRFYTDLSTGFQATCAQQGVGKIRWKIIHKSKAIKK
ncbi:TPA: hypothetical protein QEM96_004638 [Pseudomonas putida]|nr:hypothetical protein [Pseudomonas putida]